MAKTDGIDFGNGIVGSKTIAFRLLRTPPIINEPVSVGLTGALIYDNIILISPSYTDDEGNLVLENFIRLDNVQISCNKENIIIKTNIKGKDGTYKQYIQKGDFQVSIFGKLISNGKLLPIKELETLNNVLNCPEALDYECRFLSEGFNIKKLVPDSKQSFYQLEGVSNAYSFDLKFSSDE